MTRWTIGYEKCIKCGARKILRSDKMLCYKCLFTDEPKSNEQKWLPKDELRRLYIAKKMSIGDIAQKYGRSRQIVLYHMRKYGIATRNKSNARIIAIGKGKLGFTRTDEQGNEYKVTLGDSYPTKGFFRSWSPEMAYVLGFIYADGNIHLNRLRVGQKEPEILTKLLALMGSKARLHFRGKRGISGAIYSFGIGNEVMMADLKRIGLTPHKSLTIPFPEIPLPCVRHFIRGCWDGDGSVFMEGKNPAMARADYTSGSRQFIDGLIQHLVSLGLSTPSVHKKGRSFYFRYTGRTDFIKLYHILYDDVSEHMYLSRKHKLFKMLAEHNAKLPHR